VIYSLNVSAHPFLGQVSQHPQTKVVYSITPAIYATLQQSELHLSPTVGYHLTYKSNFMSEDVCAPRGEDRVRSGKLERALAPHPQMRIIGPINEDATYTKRLLNNV